jgi:hypothetical protein
MKNRIKLIGIVVAAAVICFSMSSCDFFKTGGTVEIVNQTVGRIIAYHNKIGTSFAHDASSEKIIESGQTGTWHFDEDTDVTFYWAGNDTGGTTYNGDKSNGQWGTSFTIEKGETKTIIAK